MKKCVEKSQKQTMDVIFNIQNSQLLTRSFPVEEIIQVNGQNRPVANLPVIDFRSQPPEMPLNMKLSVFRFCIFRPLLLLGKFERHSLFVYVIK